MVDGVLQVLDRSESRQQAETFFAGRLHNALTEVLEEEALGAGPASSRTYVEARDIFVP
jgi:hypothetical protein